MYLIIPCFKLIMAGRQCPVLVISFTLLALHLRVINKKNLAVPPRTQSCVIFVNLLRHRRVFLLSFSLCLIIYDTL